MLWDIIRLDLFISYAHYALLLYSQPNEKDKECWMNNKERQRERKKISLLTSIESSRKECPCSCINIILLEQTNRKRFRKITDKTLFFFKKKNPSSLSASLFLISLCVRCSLFGPNIIHRFSWPFGMWTMSEQFFNFRFPHSAEYVFDAYDGWWTMKDFLNQM